MQSTSLCSSKKGSHECLKACSWKHAEKEDRAPGKANTAAKVQSSYRDHDRQVSQNLFGKVTQSILAKDWNIVVHPGAEIPERMPEADLAHEACLRPNERVFHCKVSVMMDIGAV
jgi:hypothetical protein